MTQTVITVGEFPEPISRDENIRRRILTLLQRRSEDWTVRKWVYDANTGKERRMNNSYRWHWCRLRERIGGRVDAKMFRRLIDELEAEGEVVEVWEQTHPRRQAAHWVVSPKHFHKHDWEKVVKAKGHHSVLRRLNLDVMGLY